MTKRWFFKYFQLSGLQGRMISFFALVAVLLAGTAAYMLWETAGVRERAERITDVYLPATEELLQLEGDVNRFVSSIKTDILQRDTTHSTERDDLREGSLIPRTARLNLQKDAFSPQGRPLLDSLAATVIDIERQAGIITVWLTENSLNAFADSAFLANLATAEAAYLNPQFEQVERLRARYHRYHTALVNDIDGQVKVSLDLLYVRSGQARIVLAVVGLAVVLILTMGGYHLIRRMRRSLGDAIGVLNKLVEGDTSGNAVPGDDELRPVIEAANTLSNNLQRASEFAQHIGDGNVDHDFKAVGENDSLGNSLLQMRQKLKQINEEDRMRNWSTAGLAKFADILRRNDDYRDLAEIIVSDLVKYTKSNQGGMFIVNQDNENDTHLELIACYAFERKKYLQKRVEIGTGLVGQCYLEQRTIFLKQVPQDYVNITSGLGGANPSSLLIVPLKVNGAIEGVLEIASFKDYQPHEIEFVEQVGEIIASTISNARINDRTRRLLEESQQHSEELRAQEEEMRQNMEEMQATQEQMHRQTEEMRKMQENLALEKSMFAVLMEYLPDRITYKDAQSRILRINQSKAEKFRMSPEEMVGKTDYDFFSKEHADKAFREEQELIRTGVPVIDREERAVFANGDITWASTSRIPFRNERHETVGMFIITKDITELKKAELTIKDRERVIERLLDGMPVFRFTVNRDGLLEDVWKSSNLPELPDLHRQPASKALPEVHDLIRQEGLNDTDLICKGVLEINGEKEIFKHYLFRDSAQDGVFLGFALKC